MRPPLIRPETPAGVVVEITENARRRMEARGITEDEVAYCLEAPEREYRVKRGDTVFVRTLTDGRLIKVRRLKNSTSTLIVSSVTVVNA